MNALLSPPAWPDRMRLLPMRSGSLDVVMAVERMAYPFPWTRENFASSLASGYLAECLFDEHDPHHLIAYYVAQLGVEEMHLLNLTVAPADQRRGWGRRMLQALCVRCLQHGAAKLWLEVRVSNTHARRLYEDFGFVRVGVRRGYYPDFVGREDGIVMCLDLSQAPVEGA